MFRFKQFVVEQELTPMKVGTDGVVLGAWVSLTGEERAILDIGTGTGLIALMLAQRAQNDDVTIDAVEIDGDSAAQALGNVAASKWAVQICVHHTDIQSFAPSVKYDLIVTNPPYFVDSLQSPSQGRTTARHTTKLSFEDLAVSAERLLTPTGRFALILPVAESELFDREAEGRLCLVRRCSVRNSPASQVKRYMSEYILIGNPLCDSFEQEELAIRSGEPLDFSAEYRELTRDFYLKF